jgi:hypothetical protein
MSIYSNQKNNEEFFAREAIAARLADKAKAEAGQKIAEAKGLMPIQKELFAGTELQKEKMADAAALARQGLANQGQLNVQELQNKGGIKLEQTRNAGARYRQELENDNRLAVTNIMHGPESANWFQAKQQYGEGGLADRQLDVERGKTAAQLLSNAWDISESGGKNAMPGQQTAPGRTARDMMEEAGRFGLGNVPDISGAAVGSNGTPNSWNSASTPPTSAASLLQTPAPRFAQGLPQPVSNVNTSIPWDTQPPAPAGSLPQGATWRNRVPSSWEPGLSTAATQGSSALEALKRRLANLGQL